ncbi:MAG: Gfo/Idh/MocA family oxidoreductase [Rhodocyclaceae bacterium]|nr:Gfo/Idh/MocA family oxidoreductase [Rhodocyclaceae bacterium]
MRKCTLFEEPAHEPAQRGIRGQDKAAAPGEDRARDPVVSHGTKPPPITGRPIRVAVVGCGRISRNHFSAIAAHADQLSLAGVCDVDPARLSAAVAQTGARGFASLADMLNGTDADLVVVATPSGLHPDQTIQIAEAGRHVMTEKPMATRWEDGKRMVQACDAAGVRLFVVKQNRRNATLQLLKRAMDKKRFGRIYMATLNVFWTRPQSYYDSDDWRGTWEFDGGAFMNQASHYVDLLDWLIGPVESVQAYTATLARNIEVEDSGVALVRWRSGALGSINVTMLTYPKNLEGSITIIGETGTARVGGVAVNAIEHWEFAEPDEDDAQVADASYQTTSVYGFGHPLYYDNVIRVLRGESEPDTDGREGLRSLELLIAMYRSARDGRRVSLPLEY